VTCLRLFAFWARHIWRTSRGVDNWTDTTWDNIKTLTNQKTLEDSLLDTKQPETPAMTLDPQSAAKAFTNMLILLSKMHGITGHPLNYVPRSNLKDLMMMILMMRLKTPTFWATWEPFFFD
jgi:hypothetical protein